MKKVLVNYLCPLFDIVCVYTCVIVIYTYICIYIDNLLRETVIKNMSPTVPKLVGLIPGNS